ncbi:hypothetical protein [Rufibacter roseus]|uniref:Outer membrane protein beta-barrel domain-containing protein n=1 Tax=Rufibacter roseus TaxID=1567108 RepID=A0ABW2DKN8_9BACT|nr:hypothetical protein [Rufibacter roseus]
MKNKSVIFGLGLVLLSLSFGTAKAQEFGLGVRLGGYTSGITGKYYMGNSRAIEGILGTSFGRRGFQLTGLYEIHADALGIQNLQWFYGVGAHIGSFAGRHYYKRGHKYYHDSYHDQLTTVGIDGIVGLEYQITEIPISVGLDFKPFIDVNQDGLFLFPDGALTIRYIF